MKTFIWTGGHPEEPPGRAPYRVDDALQGLEAVVDRKDVVLAVRYGGELQRDSSRSRFRVWTFDQPSARPGHLCFVEVLQPHAVNGGAQLARPAGLTKPERLQSTKVQLTETIRPKPRPVTSLWAMSNWFSLSSPSVRAMMTLAAR